MGQSPAIIRDATVIYAEIADRKVRAATAGPPSSRAEMTATLSAPAARTSGARAAVMPPMATSGRPATRVSAAAARTEGVRIAQEILEQVHSWVQGVQIRGPFKDYAAAIEVLSVKGVRQ